MLKKCRCESIVSYFGVCFRNSSLWVRSASFSAFKSSSSNLTTFLRMCVQIMMESCDMGSLTDVLNVVGHVLTPPQPSFFLVSLSLRFVS